MATSPRPVGASDHGADGQRHGAQMHGHVVAHGYGLGSGIVDGAGVVAAFLDVGREGGLAQHDAHFVRDGDEDVAEDFEFDGIGFHWGGAG